MALVIGQAKAIVFPRLLPIKSDLPEHRQLKKMNRASTRYLIDFKSEQDDEDDQDDDED